MSDLNSIDKELNQQITQGKALDAFETYYADDVVMQENTDDPRKGKAACREAEHQFFASIEQVHRVELISAAVGADVSFSEWSFDFTYKDGNRRKMEQVSRRRWKDGKVVDERFYYKAG
ncbi:MAG TPA: nuclear transport factor 2 family protein [Kofleriaceae bacterium]|nr:nuclear transport factor 2 family protein [Kofleriaceae bacterium]